MAGCIPRVMLLLLICCGTVAHVHPLAGKTVVAAAGEESCRPDRGHCRRPGKLQVGQTEVVVAVQEHGC
jgi:hypothetical protein